VRTKLPLPRGSAGTPDRHDPDARTFEMPTASPGERHERELVGNPLQKYDRGRGGPAELWPVVACVNERFVAPGRLHRT